MRRGSVIGEGTPRHLVALMGQSGEIVPDGDVPHWWCGQYNNPVVGCGASDHPLFSIKEFYFEEDGREGG